MPSHFASRVDWSHFFIEVFDMRFVLAFRNLVHDRVNFLLVAGGVAVAITLVQVQLGIFVGFRHMTAGIIDHAGAELWIVPKGTMSFDDPASTLDLAPATVAAATGVRSVRPLVVGFAQWRTPAGESQSTIIVGTGASSDSSLPWSLDSVPRLALDQPDGVIVDRTYQSDLGVRAVGDLSSIETRRARVTAFTSGIRSFTSSPYVFTRIGRAREYLGMDPGRSTYLLVNIMDSAQVEVVGAELARRFRSVDILTRKQFRDLNADHWLFSTGAGAALMGGAMLGMLVGAAIVAQTLYAGTKDHLVQFATLRALGARRRYVVQVVLLQALTSGLFGYAAAMVAGMATATATASTAMPVVMPLPLALLLFVLTMAVCGVAAIGAIVKVMRVDPMTVFSR